MILTKTMKALVYLGSNRRIVEEKPKPEIQFPTDAVVKMSKVSICGTDVHILKGDLPEVEPGRILGHEGVGVVESAGIAVTNFKPGDRVVVSCISACGKCGNCRKQMYSRCAQGGWILGRTADGLQSEYARIPFADNSMHLAPPSVDEEALVMLCDVFPTGFEVGVLNGGVKPGDTVVIVGGGPVGLSALLTSQLFSPAQIFMVDQDENRLNTAQQWGASHVIRGERAAVIDAVFRLTHGRGADVAIEAVGVPETFDVCQSILAPGGRLAVIGVFAKSAELRLNQLWSQNITVTTGLVDTRTIPRLLEMAEADVLDPKKMVTHRFDFGDIMRAYDVFANAAREKALKVIVSF